MLFGQFIGFNIFRLSLMLIISIHENHMFPHLLFMNIFYYIFIIPFIIIITIVTLFILFIPLIIVILSFIFIIIKFYPAIIFIKYHFQIYHQII